MVADYFSADFGYLRDPTNPKRNAHRCMRPGKGCDGYFTSVEVREQAAAARALVKELYPDFDHVFVYDNATTHKKRSEGSLSARGMPKGPSGTRTGFEHSNFLVEVHNCDTEGKQLYDTKGNLVKEKIKMTGAHFEDGTPQDLYFPDNHPHHPGKFKGMKQILEKRGMHQYAALQTECPSFKSTDPGEKSKCCCRRVVFNLPDFAETKSLLEEECEIDGVEVLFLPKFHCELNPIEMVWGYAKRLYRLKPESSREDVLEKNTMESLDGVPLLLMRR
jgi:transposase